MMKKILLACMLFAGLGASAQILVSESFEGTTTPGGFAYSSFSRTTTAGRACTGTAAVNQNFYGSSTTGNIVYTSTASNATALNFSFNYQAQEYNVGSLIGGSFKVEYSVNGGTSYTQVGSTVALSSTTPCTAFSGTIAAGVIPVGANFKFRIAGTRTSGDYYLIIDDVSLAQTVTAAPACTTVTAPANAATGVSITPTLNWAIAGGTSSYLLNLGTTSGGTNVLNGVNTGTNNTYVVPSASALLYNTTYYLNITPGNSFGSAAGCTESTFTTINVPCPSVSAPANNAVNLSLKPTLTWSATTGANGYRLSVGTTSGGTDILNAVDLGNTISYTFPTNLTASTAYFYTVTAYQGANTSTACTIRKFTTGAAGLPANDDCSGAITLTVNPDLSCGSVTPGNTLGASLSMAATPCFGNPDDDVYFKFVATATSHTISLRNVVATAGSSTDMYFQVLSGACGTLTSILCSDPDSSTVSGLTVGDTYYIRVYVYEAAGSNASFNICVGTNPPPPANDGCSGAVSITPGATFAQNAVTGTTAGATTDGTATCQSNSANNVWFSVVVPANGNITLETDAAATNTLTDTVLQAFSGSCGTLTSLGCNDDDGNGNHSKLVLTGLTPASTIYVSVWVWSSATLQSGNFQFSAYDGSLGTVNTIKENNGLNIYPNPFTDFIRISDVKDVVSVSVVDMAGRIVKTMKPEREINLSTLKSGMYLINLSMKDGSVKTVKSIKK